MRTLYPLLIAGTLAFGGCGPGKIAYGTKGEITTEADDANLPILDTAKNVLKTVLAGNTFDKGELRRDFSSKNYRGMSLDNDPMEKYWDSYQAVGVRETQEDIGKAVERTSTWFEMNNPLMGWLNE
ncbi:hypothetical protein CL616_01260 [archaeon]|nr:hypothetical protein [archaeon]|tara:strand:+ start:839 stop:1216 length:378 start_codon:yes stop_codon:yes gene_type:complete